MKLDAVGDPFGALQKIALDHLIGFDLPSEFAVAGPMRERGGWTNADAGW